MESVTGRYVQKIYLGKPPTKKILEYNSLDIEAIKVYFSPQIKIIAGYEGIYIKLKRLFIYKWLALEGASCEGGVR